MTDVFVAMVPANLPVATGSVKLLDHNAHKPDPSLLTELKFHFSMLAVRKPVVERLHRLDQEGELLSVDSQYENSGVLGACEIDLFLGPDGVSGTDRRESDLQEACWLPAPGTGMVGQQFAAELAAVIKLRTVVEEDYLS